MNFMNFSMSTNEFNAFTKWYNEHYTKETCKYFDDGKSPISPQGAIGGVLTFSFTPTSIGMGVGVKCACGAEVNVTDYGEW